MTSWQPSRVRAMVLAFLILASASIRAHEGHLHKVMGAVVTASPDALAVKGADGKTLTLVIDRATKIVRGTTVIAASELHAGDRVVVSYMPMKGAGGAEMLMARDVKAAASRPPAH
jgi:hypothetical protein